MGRRVFGASSARPIRATTSTRRLPRSGQSEGSSELSENRVTFPGRTNGRRRALLAGASGMRKTRWLLAGLMCAALAPAAASAQRTREFEDSWFWGVKGGVSTFTPTLGESETSATYGAEWVITRRRGALYVAVDEANINTTSAVFDPTAEGSFRPVGVEKLRRISFAALAFPKSFG